MAEDRRELPARLGVPAESWKELSTADRAPFLAAVSRDVERLGLAVIGEVLTADRCVELVHLLLHEVRHAIHIERMMHARRRRRDGYRIYNLISRHSVFLELMMLPFAIDVAAHLVGERMILRDSEGIMLPGGCGRDAEPGFDGPEPLAGPLLSVSLTWCLGVCDGQAGSLRFVPGTHRDPIGGEEAAKRETNRIALGPGDLVVVHPNLWHVWEENRGSVDRCLIKNGYQRPYLRTPFDHTRCLTAEQARRLTPAQRQLLGFGARTARDIGELYLLRPELREFDPYGAES